MKIEPFDEGLEHRNIVPYDPIYADVFDKVRAYALACLTDVEFVHIGSTAVPELRGKPMIDVASVVHQGRRFNINIHICHQGDPVHKDSLAFIDILNRRPDLRRKYEDAKDRAHAIDPVNPQVYNREKEVVIKEIEALIPSR
jgi:GrpB-like predicted nucleotidyltransferase (UPF0157 family)